MTQLAVIIITWNNADVIAEALRSILDDLQTTQIESQVLVVDSASTDATVTIIREQFPAVRLFARTENVGFGRANNIGLEQVGFGGTNYPTLPDYIFFLNPDTITTMGATTALLNVIEADKRLGVVGAALTYSDGAFQHSAFAFPGLRQLWIDLFPAPGRLADTAFNGRYARALYAGDEPFDVDFVLGATMLMRREVIIQTGMFDDTFFLYAEEVDWQWRIHKAGWRIAVVPAAHIVHLGGQSTHQALPESIRNLWLSRLKLFAKHYPAWKNWLARQLIRVGMQRRLRTPSVDEAVAQAYRDVIAAMQA